MVIRRHQTVGIMNLNLFCRLIWAATIGILAGLGVHSVMAGIALGLVGMAIWKADK